MLKTTFKFSIIDVKFMVKNLFNSHCLDLKPASELYHLFGNTTMFMPFTAGCI